ncbi:FmdB family zinc ribbon protein [Mycobacterium spongiae]|uniref:FmdB family transcriptional regulator n=1 Tax=Mycobacterium spongiae TaxID=886343 RepID=A0A975K0C9_9MYCO|nr:FmdB family zinc ribbon protein [Mycobacterium spongiae]QUR68718.1 FmdB family transcriptional regulator [Mycobacterium spongiae]
MPTYSYACTECAHRFDVVQAFTDDALSTCDRCSGRLRKLFNAVGVVFKGSGFYRTDSRESAKTSNGSPNGSSGNGSTSNDSKASSESKASTERTTSSSTEKSSSSPAPSTAAASS